MIRNGTFTEGWRDLPPSHGNLINQEPAGWNLAWLRPGDQLYDDPGAQATGVPECVHKLQKQLPPNEHLGGPDALILAGDTTYKIFHAHAPFGATLSQTVTGLAPGNQATLRVPVQLHLHGEEDPFGAESGVWVNGEGGWVHGGKMGDRKWYVHEVPFTVPEDGRAEVVIRVKSKWQRPKDFFIDGVTLDVQAVAPPPSEPPTTEPPAVEPPRATANFHRVTAPSGVNLRHSPDTELPPITLLPEGAQVNVESIEDGWARITAYISAEWLEKLAGGGGG